MTYDFSDIPSYMPTGTEKEVFDRTQNRIQQELLPAREHALTGPKSTNVQTTIQTIEELWRDCDALYVPHSYHGTSVDDTWQSTNSQPNPYAKIVTALSIVVAQNPEVVLIAAEKQYKKKNELIKALYRHTWEKGLSKFQLEMFAFNLAKYGFAVGRTYHRVEQKEIHDLDFIDPETEEKKFVDKMIFEYNDVFLENMNPWNCWFDDMAIPGDPFSVRDWTWRKVYSWSEFQRLFLKKLFPGVQFVRPGGNKQIDLSGTLSDEAEKIKTEHTVEVFFYENQKTDEFRVMANDVLITPIESPLPYKHKRLSGNFTQWTLRDTNSIYGIGVVEALRQDQETLDKIRNMSIDQLVLSIYKMFFTGPGTQFQEGTLKVAPGRVHRVTDPSEVKEVGFSGPGGEAAKWIEQIRNDMDESTGITKALGGEFIGKTAFEAQQNKEAGLRKMRLVLEHIEYFLTLEARNRIDLIQQIYAVPIDVERIVGAKTFMDYQLESQQKPELYFASNEKLFRYRNVPLAIQEGKDGFTTQKEPHPFDITPEGIRWEGEIRIRPQSTVKPSKELDRQMKLDLFNVIAKLPDIDIEKAQRAIIEAFDENPDDWMLSEEALQARQQAALQAQGMQGMEQEMSQEGALETVVPRSETRPQEQGGFLSNLLGKVTGPFRQ